MIKIVFTEQDLKTIECERFNHPRSSPKVAVNFIPPDWCPFHGIYTTVSCGVLF